MTGNHFIFRNKDFHDRMDILSALILPYEMRTSARTQIS